MSIQHQVHEKFKVFAGKSIEEINTQVKDFTSHATIDAKSIGVEYVEAKGQLIVSLGYTEDAGGYAAQLKSKPIGTLDADSPSSLEALGAALTSAAQGVGEVICHELYVKDNGEATAVFLEKI